MKNYLIYPVKVMNITQTYSGKTSHNPNMVGKPSDYPIDEAGENTGRQYMYCPCDEMVVRRIYGVGNGGTNTLWLESTDKVIFADRTSDYFSLMIIHPNDDDLKKISVGQVFKRNEKICREGTDGVSSGNHFHFSGGKGKIKGSGWEENNLGKWVLTVKNKTAKPEKLFYIDEDFTTIKSSKGLSFKALSTAMKNDKPQSENYIVTASLLYVRKGPGTNYGKVKFSDFTPSAKEQIMKLSSKKADGYVKGVEFTALEIKGEWAKTPSGWVSLKYCKKK